MKHLSWCQQDNLLITLFYCSCIVRCFPNIGSLVVSFYGCILHREWSFHLFKEIVTMICVVCYSLVHHFWFRSTVHFYSRLVKLQLFCKASVDELFPYVQCSFLLFSVFLFLMAITPFIFRIILKVTLKYVLFQ